MMTPKMEYRMIRSLLICALVVATTAALAAQQTSQPDPYQGTSTPPPNDTITNSVPTPDQPAAPPAATTVVPKPSPAQPLYAQPASGPRVQSALQPPPSASQAYSSDPADGTDDGIVQIAPDPGSMTGQPTLNQRTAANDPDGDIVHPAPLGPNELGEGTTIRVRLLQRITTAYTQDGEAFRTRVASDVLQDGQVLIPAGA